MTVTLSFIIIIQAELFRGHEASVVTIVFSDFTGAMFSLDVAYHLFVWDYSKLISC